MVANLVIVFACVGAAVGFLFAVTRTSPTHSRKESNDFTGAVVAVIGTTYAVLLAFMLSGVWTMFQQAEVNADQEANDLVNVYRISSQLGGPGRGTLQDLARTYAETVLNSEFPAMNNDQEPSHTGGEIVEQMWGVVGQLKSQPDDQQLLGESMSTLRNLTEHRRIRLTQGREKLPAILWAVLIAGGVITITAACFFGVSNFRFHLLQVIVLSFLISLILVAIADIDRPYQGDVKVSSASFESALSSFNRQAK